MYDFTNVDPVKCCTWLVLPTVYDESLSYGEQLNKFCKALNELIQNNNNIPDYVAEMIQNYITSGAIDEVVRNVLASYILNVKYPPKGITPAVGDGSADDTEAIQGCIDYAFNQGGGCVYLPYGKYLSRSLTLRSGVSLIGFDRYSTRIVQRGGDTKPLVSGGNVQNVQISNLTLDGNNEVQTDDLDVVNILGKDILLNNLVVKSGYQCLVYNGLGGDLQVSNVVFGGAVKKVAVINGKDSVQFENVKFNELGQIQGECVLEVGASDGVYRFSSKAIAPVCIKCVGNRNSFIADIVNSTNNFVDSGMMNNFNVLGVEVKEQLAENKNVTVGGDTSENIAGDKIEIIGGSKSETVTQNKTENISGNREIDIDGTDSIHVDGVSSVNIGGARTEVYNASKNTKINGTSENVYNDTYTSTFKNKLNVNGVDITANFSSDAELDAQNINLNANKQITCNGITNIKLLKYSNPTIINSYFKEVNAIDENNENYSLLIKNDKNLNELMPYEYLQGKKIMVFGDSISDEVNNPSFEIHPNWVQSMREMLSGIATVDNNSLAGRRMIELPNIINNYNSLDYDIVIIFLGTNDYGSNIPLGYNYQTDEHVNDWFSPAVRASWERIRAKLVKANKPESQIVYITPLYRESISNALFSIDCYTSSITSFANRWGTTFINGTACNPLSEHTTQYFMPDKLHLNPAGGKILANYVINKLCSGCDSVANFSPNRIKSLPIANSTHNPVLNATYNIDTNGLNLIVTGTFTPSENITDLPIIDFSTIANLITLTNNTIYGVPYLFSNTDGFIPSHTYIDGNNMRLKADDNKLFTKGTQYSLMLHDKWLPGFMNFPQNV